MAHYLTRSRHGTAFYVRVVVPAHLRNTIGRTELRRSLGEIPLKLARLRAAEKAHRFNLVFDALRDMAARKSPEIGLLDKVLRGADGSISLEGVRFDPANLDADVRAFQSILSARPGGCVPEPAPAALRPFQDVCHLFIKEHTKAGAWTEKTRQEVESLLGRYGDHCSARKLDVYSKDAATSFKTERLLPELTVKTVNKHVSRLASFFSWAKRNGYANENVFEGLTVRKAKAGKASDDREAYSLQDVQALLGTLDPAKDDRHWLPLLGLYTGARINELAQLRVDDVRTDALLDAAYVDINPDGAPGKRLKNAQSRRVVPVHSELRTRGFLTYVESLRNFGKDRVFPMFPLGRDGYGQAGSRWFARHRAKHALTKDFHGLRHTVSTVLREAGVNEDVVAELLGHSYGSTMSFARYSKASSLGKLRDAIEKLRYA